MWLSVLQSTSWLLLPLLLLLDFLLLDLHLFRVPLMSPRGWELIAEQECVYIDGFERRRWI